jgi:hypothetical protein
MSSKARLSKKAGALEIAIYKAQNTEDAAARAEGRAARCILTLRDGVPVYGDQRDSIN